MGLTELIKDKKRILVIGIIAFVIFAIPSLLKTQKNSMLLLKENINQEMKKSELLSKIIRQENNIAFYKDLLVKKDISAGMNTVTALAKETGLKTVLMKPLAEDNNPLFIRYPVNLVLNASSYHDIARFISKVESYPNIYMVESMRIDPVDRSKEAEAIYRLSVSLTISTVSFKD